MLIYNYTPDFIFFAGLLCGEGPAKNEFRIQNPEGPEKKGPESGLPIHTSGESGGSSFQPYTYIFVT